jgi:pimeloyl-ACP methyl ester carboxylesterase
MLLLLVAGCAHLGSVVGDPGDVPRSRACTLARTVSLRTEDGATVALHHHAAAGPPVLLVHGISSNHHFFDLDAEHSLADWLVDRGHDVWMLDLRGHGDAMRDIEGRQQRAGWTVDDYGHFDVPAAVAHIQACTGASKLAYIGHSMGGMVGSIYAASGGAEHLSSLTYLGSPGAFSKDVPMVKLAQTAMAAGGATHIWFDTSVLADASADLARGNVRVRVQERLYNPENFEPTTLDRMLRNIVSPMSRGEMQHFARMIADERFESWDRKTDWLVALQDVEVPAFLVVGTGDRIVAPEWAEAYADAFAGPVEVFRAGKESGLEADYGHLDLALGERAATEIFPRVGAWIERHR